MQLMRRRKVNSLIITNKEGRYLGVVGAEEIYEHFQNEQATAQTAMRRDGPTVFPDASVHEVLNLLQTNARGFLPVVDSTERLIGVVTRASVLNVITASDDGEVEANRIPVAGI